MLPTDAGATLLPIARATIADALGRAQFAPEDAPWLQGPGACFVTLNQRGVLRGCIGTLEVRRSLLEDVKANAVKEAELIVKDAELLSERLVSQGMSRVADLERAIQELKIERKTARNRLQSTLDTLQQYLMLDMEQEANEMPITTMFRARNE